MMKRTVLLIATTLLIVGCGSQKTRSFQRAAINCLVLFELQDPTDTGELVGDCGAKISTVDGSVSCWCGVAGDCGRSHVDRDCGVCLYVGFESGEVYGRYLDHPDHVALVQKRSSVWRWVQVRVRVHDIVGYSQI
jgi:hypothetical protein